MMRAGNSARVVRGLVVAVVVVLGCSLLARLWLGVAYSPLAMALDAAFLVPVSIGIALATRWRWQPWLGTACLGLLFVVGHAYKLAMLGAPIELADAVAGVELLRILSGWRLAVAVAALSIWCAALLAASWPASMRRAAWLLAPAGWVTWLLLFPGPAATALQALDDDPPPQQAARLVRQGGIAYLVRALDASDAQAETIPSRGEVAAALKALGVGPTPVPSAAFHPRPIHAVLLESLWDPRQLEAYRFSSDPFDPAFRAAWEAGGRSTVLVPSFGGATANAEFEFLCALPSLRGSVTFEDALRNPVPCLPRLLRAAGYETVAIHPHMADYWNRQNAYPRLGFESYRPISAFARDDLDGAFLADASTFRQVREWAVGEPATRPRFTWLVSLGSHYPYDRNAGKRPDLVRVTPAAPLLQAYANATRYTTAAFMDYVESILASEPDALIVAFGDHAPVLGTHPDPYAELRDGVGAAAPIRPSAYPVLARTPLVVIDGRNGPVAVGDVPLYRLAPRVLALLGSGHPVLPQAPAAANPHNPTMRARLFFNHMLRRGEDGRWRPCDAPSAGCSRVEAVRTHLSVLRDDLIQGHQYALGMLDAREFALPVRMDIVEDYAACGLQVENWGPRFTSAGQPFNLQPSGRSAFWFSVREARGAPKLRVAGLEVPFTVAGSSASASIGGVIEQPGVYPLTWVCADGSEGSIGEFTVQPGSGG